MSPDDPPTRYSYGGPTKAVATVGHGQNPRPGSRAREKVSRINSGKSGGTVLSQAAETATSKDPEHHQRSILFHPVKELPKTYSPADIEGQTYKRWEASGYFNPDKLPNAKKRKPFVISMPPPNITGELHLGHALGMTIQDILIRYHRMNGRAALWLPGTDHAAIATQVLVERDLRQQGIDPKSLGREKFLAKVWAWKKKYGGRIIAQVKRMGASADWSRERFTMDDGLTLAVQTAFKKLYDDGLIYRGERIINWCPDCGTAISDLEVDHQETPGKLWQIRYTLSAGGREIVVATTRPETMLGDTAVAVNPDDERYRDFVGKTVTVPIVNRQIPIITDKRIDKDFGTGAVKITPAHDPLDFDIGQDHKLPIIRVIGFDGRMTTEAGSLVEGKTVLEARELVLERLRPEGALVGVEDYIHTIGYCSRSKTIVEPLVSRQWFVTMAPLAKTALRAVQSKKITIVPERYERVYYHWLKNIRDWNISRQIWWGHRLPVWYKKSDLHHDQPKVSIKRPGLDWVQDTDTLDTWFSSGLWTFSTLGWPKSTADLKRFHPTDVMETGWDILFFWVARMIMLSLYLEKEIPFKTIYLHGLILDEQGKKMSKSKGTGIDPLPLADKYGMDALRMSLIVGNAAGQDFRLYEKKIEGYRNFSNKLWNIARYILAQPVATSTPVPSIADEWIRARLRQTITAVTKQGIERYDFSTAGQALYDFLWHDLADWYIEASKISPNPAVLQEVFTTSLILLHPFMPFITEQLWSSFGNGELLMVAPWPKLSKRATPGAVKEFENIQQTVIALRNFKIHSDLPSGAMGEYLGQFEEKLLAGLSRVSVRHRDRLNVSSDHTPIILGPTRFQFERTFVDRYESWRQKERAGLERYSAGIEKKLANPSFVQHAPADVVAAERQKLAEVKQRLLEL